MKPFIGWRLCLLSLFFFVPFFSWAITRIVKSQTFDNNCGYYLNEAFNGSQNDNENVAKKIDTAINYLESNKLTSGFTSIFDKTSDEDISSFYESLKKKDTYAHALKDMNESDLSKFKEYADMRNLKSSSQYSAPEGISVYPHNTLFFVWMIISIISAGLGVIGFITFIDERAHIR